MSSNWKSPTASEQGAAPDRPQCCRFSSVSALVVVGRDWRAAGELSRCAGVRGVSGCDTSKNV